MAEGRGFTDRQRQAGGQWADHRTVINGVLVRARTGVPWPDLPAASGVSAKGGGARVEADGREALGGRSRGGLTSKSICSLTTGPAL
ncbi:transposase [Streptomyces gilvosporeus]|uniref:Insertion element IS402-like domain-containing protein n=1 Tax=Streptomyces gilvosporeus TaxID=553510 RepID=A0A1V0TKP9_9ACTN|nr:hypothetical protein B1H19_02705 [Streptomyces gilvosporeus]